MSSGRSGFAELLKKKPRVPEYPTVDIEREQIDQAKANQESLLYLQPLATDINRFMAQETEQNLRRALPGAYDQIQGNIQAALKGQIPQDVEEGLRRRRAELGISRGTSGSQGEEFAALRDLGLTSLSRSDFGLQAAERWMQVARSPTFDITSGFVPIQQRISLKAQENQMKFQRDWLRNQIHAIPSGWKAVAIKVLDYVADVGTAALSMYMGGAMGGGGGGMGGGGGGSAGPYSSNSGGNWAGMGGVGGGGGASGARGAWWEQP
jgi:hypothetical protein